MRAARRGRTAARPSAHGNTSASGGGRTSFHAAALSAFAAASSRSRACGDPGLGKFSGRLSASAGLKYVRTAASCACAASRAEAKVPTCTLVNLPSPPAGTRHAAVHVPARPGPVTPM